MKTHSNVRLLNLPSCGTRALARPVLAAMRLTGKRSLARLWGLAVIVAALGFPIAVAPNVQAGVTYQNLHSFCSFGTEGALPSGSVIEASDGYLYGTTQNGGSGDPSGWGGTVFKLAKNGLNFQVIYSFPPASTHWSADGLLEGSDGYLYGVTGGGGNGGYGTVFKLTKTGSGYTTIHHFGATTSDGRNPSGALVEASDGYLYGATGEGGSAGYGTVFKMTKNGSDYQVLKSFTGSGGDGRNPIAPLLLGSDGALYGAAGGGSAGYGIVFKLNKDGFGYAVVWNFGSGGSDARWPAAALLEGNDGALYGTAGGGSAGYGTVFKLNKDGSAFTTLHSFTWFGCGEGAIPMAPVVEGWDGALYGTTISNSCGGGLVFKLNKDGTGFAALWNFSSPWTGHPRKLVSGSDRALYGTTDRGPEMCYGTVFRLSTVPPNTRPVAMCKNVTVPAGDTCTASASIDNGSYDPDPGDTIRLAQIPPGPYPLGPTLVRLTATDSQGASNVCVATVTVVDVTPPIVICPDPIIANADGNCQAPVPDLAIQVVAGDNCDHSLALSQNPPAGTMVTLGTTTITVTATDDAGNSANCTTTLTVVDRTPPTVSCPPEISLPADANCQAAVPDLTSQVTASDNCDQQVTLSQSPAAGTLVGLGLTTITVTATDDAGNSANCTTTLTVVDRTPPTVSCPAGTSVAADATCQAAVPDLTSQVIATDNCDHSLTLNQDPRAGTMVGLGVTIITVTATDDAGNSAGCTTTFTVVDSTPPTVSCPAGSIVHANARCQAPVPDLTIYAVASDNCDRRVTLSQNPPAGTVVELGVTAVTITATDAAGNSASCSTTINVVDNTPPTVTCPPGITVPEDANHQAPVPDITGQVTASDNCAQHVTVSQNPPAGTMAGLGTTTITVTATDEAGNSASCTTAFTVVGSTPLVLGPITVLINPIPVNRQEIATASFTDDVPLQTAAWDWGDGATSAGVVDETAETVTGDHAYATPGVYEVTLTVTDQAGREAQHTFQFVVVYDSAGGFVTGGGWIHSPAGAYAPDPTLTGKANFGFVSKYKPGARAPTGQTEFHFAVADLNFHSSQYDWLVVSAARAQYKGSGTINGVAGYSFILTAADGQVPGGGGVDKFRIKIWERATGTIVYDNQMGASDTAEATLPIAGGSIVIHR